MFYGIANNTVQQKQEKFFFLPLISNPVTIRLSFLLLSISAITSSNKINN